MSVIALACIALLAAAFAGGAQARTVTATAHASSASTYNPPPITAGSGYLALGDSVSFGYEEPAVVPAPNYADASSFVGFPEVIASDLGLTVANAACPGETSASLINDTAQSNGCETTYTGSPGYREAYPLHVSYPGSQLSYGVKYLEANRNVSLVTVMVGANDYFLCEETTADQCQSPAEQEGVLVGVKRNVKKILTTLRDKAHYKGQLVIVDYYATSQSIAGLTQVLNAYINKGGSRLHVQIANAYAAFQAASVDSGGDPCTAGLLTQLSTGGCGIHPSLAGQTVIASSVLQAVHIY